MRELQYTKVRKIPISHFRLMAMTYRLIFLICDSTLFVFIYLVDFCCISVDTISLDLICTLLYYAYLIFTFSCMELKLTTSYDLIWTAG